MAATEHTWAAPSCSAASDIVPVFGGTARALTNVVDFPSKSLKNLTAPFYFVAPYSGFDQMAKYWAGLLCCQGEAIYSPGEALYTVVFPGVWAESLVMRLDPASTELSVAPLQTAQPVEWERLDFELMRLGNLGPNWDGEGAEAVSPVSVHTVRILLRLAREASARVPFAQYSLPSLFASIEGGICLKWDVGQRELKCVAVGETVEVIRWRSRDRFESDGFWELSAPKVAEHFEWLLR